MQVLGLLQNTWAHDSSQVEELMSRFGRHAIVTRLLMESLTGKCIKRYLPDWYQRIIYENSSPRILSRNAACSTVDLPHVRRVVADVEPNVIVAFGDVAGNALRRLRWQKGPGIITRHPMAREAGVTDRLREINTLLNGLNELWFLNSW